MTLFALCAKFPAVWRDQEWPVEERGLLRAPQANWIFKASVFQKLR